ncbi:phosphate starvation-inducible protein [Vibrio phage BONAISHI]|nr:phosphate starvation-inducible protein [Vibrio phage BONAISHI]
MDENTPGVHKVTKVDLLKEDLPRVDIRTLFGPDDYNLKCIDEYLGTSSHYIDGTVVFQGPTKEAAKHAKKAFYDILFHLKDHKDIDQDTLKALVSASKNKEHKFGATTQVQILEGTLKLVNSEQQALWDAFHNNDIIIVNGPAGTGKTLLSIGYAIMGLTEERFKKIIFSRPAVETSESIGALPGDESQKIAPFLRPIYDNLSFYVSDPKWAVQNIDDGNLETNHVGYMRGRSLRDTFMFFDEVQNMTVSEAKMAVTRIANGSKVVLAGDRAQCDLGRNYRDPESGYTNGLDYLYDKLVNEQSKIKGVAVIELTESSVMRHPTVKNLLPYI